MCAVECVHDCAVNSTRHHTAAVRVVLHVGEDVLWQVQCMVLDVVLDGVMMCACSQPGRRAASWWSNVWITKGQQTA